MNVSNYINLGNITSCEYEGQTWYDAKEVASALGLADWQNDRHKFFGLPRREFAGHILLVPSQQEPGGCYYLLEDYITKSAILQLIIMSDLPVAL